jgi:hypothetical protein
MWSILFISIIIINSGWDILENTLESKKEKRLSMVVPVGGL